MCTRICESMNITLTRSVFDDRPESAWHVLNSGWHCEADSSGSPQPGAGGRGRGGSRGEDAGPIQPLLRGWGPSGPGGLLLLASRGWERSQQGVSGVSYTHPCHTAPTRPRLCAPVTALVTLSCHHLFPGRL